MKLIKKMVKYVGYIHWASYDPDSILELVSPKSKSIKLLIDGEWVRIKFKSLRLQCFKRSKVCVSCGIEGTVMSLDKFKKSSKIPSAHFNLYAEKDGESRLMTKDHIIPKSKGGKNHLDNLQTMCDHCNSKKGSTYDPE